MSAAVNQASPCSQRPFTNSPIFLRLPVKITSGTTAKLSCSDKNHLAQDEQLFRALLAGDRDHDDGGNDGQRARDQPAQPGRDLRWMKPSITTCPASVPVIEEFCPLASSAMANSVLAPAAPSSGLSSL